MTLLSNFILTGRSGSQPAMSIKVTIQNPASFTKEQFLEWLFKVTNASAECLNETDKLVLEANRETLHKKLWCVSVGDCFNFNEEPTTFCCYPIGWTEVPVGNLYAYFGKGGERAGVLPAPIGKKGLVHRFDTDKSV
jgi:hypothetical protein